MPLLTTALSKDQQKPELTLTMIVTMQQLISQPLFGLSLSAHLKTNVTKIMFSWGEKRKSWSRLLQDAGPVDNITNRRKCLIFCNGVQELCTGNAKFPTELFIKSWYLMKKLWQNIFKKTPTVDSSWLWKRQAPRCYSRLFNPKLEHNWCSFLKKINLHGIWPLYRRNSASGGESVALQLGMPGFLKCHDILKNSNITKTANPEVSDLNDGTSNPLCV